MPSDTKSDAKKLQTSKPQNRSETVDVKPTRSPHFRYVYSNNLKTTTLPLEIRLTFGQVADGIGIGQYVNEEEVGVCIPLPLIRNMLEQIESSLQQHEEKFGPIKPFTAPQTDDKSASQSSQTKSKRTKTN